MKLTIKEYLIDKGYSSDDAERYIRGGKVMINSEVMIVPSFVISSEDKVEVKELKEWVSRGAYKLLKAIEEFKIDFKNKVTLDIGSSTGGFTEVSLENGSKKVYSVDVGTNQLDYKLRSHNKVKVMEKTNLKTLKRDMFNESIDIAVTDVSFISLKRVFDVLKEILDKDKILMALIKPQFEANSDQIQKGGYVPEELHETIINNIKQYASEHGFECIKIDKSPIMGGKSKNIEYISLFRRT